MNTSHIHRQTSLRLILTAGLSVSIFAATSHAQTLSWANSAGGSAATAANWSPVQVPGAANPLVWNLPNTFTTTFPGTVPLSASHTFKRGLVTLSITSPHTASTFVRVGDLAGDSATTILTTGTLHAGGGVTIGNNSGATGTLTVDNESSLLDTTAAGTDIVVGSSGTGTLNITDGASVVPADDLFVGLNATGTGHVTVSGTGGLPLPAPSSTLDLTGTGKDITIGLSGDGTFDVLSGARVNADEMFLGLNPGSTGIVTVGGIGGILNTHAQINIATSLHLGDNPGVGANGGTAQFTVNDDGIVNVLGTTRIGDSTGVGSGTLTIQPGGTFTTNSLVATDTGGFLNLLGGVLNIDGGSLTTRNDVLTLEGQSGNTAVVALLNGATCTLSAPTSPFEAMIIGNTATGVFDVFSGSQLSITGDAILGNLASGTGQMQVTGAGSTATIATARQLILGDAGHGACYVQSGGHLSTGSVVLGRTATGVGIAEVNNGSAVWDINGTLSIGGTATAAAGTGSVSIGTAGVAGPAVNIASGGVGTTSVEAWGAGDSLVIGPGGTLVADGTVHIHPGASFVLDGGTIDSTPLILDALNSNARGTIRGEIFNSAGNNVLALTGDLLLTDGAFSLSAVTNFGTIDVGAHTFTFTSSNTSQRALGGCHIGAGGRLVSPMSLVVTVHTALSGEGTVDASILNLGEVVSQGAGLTFRKVLSGVGQGISGSTITFANGGGFTGSGVFSNATPINALGGSVITATGDLTMGSATSSLGFNGNFTRLVITGPFDVTLNDSAQAVVGDVAFPTSGAGSPTVRCTTGLAVIGNITGSGVVASDFNSSIAVHGNVSPGESGDTGTIKFSGDTVLSPSAHIVMDIESPNSADLVATIPEAGVNPPFDLFQSDLALNGIFELRVNPGFTPFNGEGHTLIRCSGPITDGGHFTGAFQTIIRPAHWMINVRHSGLGLGPDSLVAIYCTADFNNDDTVDFFDYLDFVDAFASGQPSADFNADGVIDFFDYLDFVDAFATGC